MYTNSLNKPSNGPFALLKLACTESVYFRASVKNDRRGYKLFAEIHGCLCAKRAVNKQINAPVM